MKQTKKVKLKLGIVTVITVSYLFVSTALSSALVLTSWKNAQIQKQAQNEELNKQIIAQNMKMSEAKDGVLEEIGESKTKITDGEETAKALVGSADTSKWDLNRVTIAYDTAGVPVPVPKGFVASGAAEEHTVSTGFVIYEGTGAVTTSNAWEQSKARNQFVWVPVNDIDRIYTTDDTYKKKAKVWKWTDSSRVDAYSSTMSSPREPEVCATRDFDDIGRLNVSDLTGYTRDRFYKNLQSEYMKTLESIEKYGGFYIGRYETGNIHSQTPVVRRMNTQLDEESWYDMYLRMKNISNNENVQTSMIWGSLWDETLQWLIDTGAKTQYQIAVDSTSWGNYENVTFTYLNASENLVTKNSPMMIPTGSSERNKANNIYDLAGNAFEWTLECEGYFSHYFRGGNYNWGDEPFRAAPVQQRIHYRGNLVFEGNSARAQLYIK